MCHRREMHVSTHATRAGRDLHTPPSAAELDVSTHATRAGRDVMGCNTLKQLKVSTHATRAGRDSSTSAKWRSNASFNSRDPCGSRLNAFLTIKAKRLFQLTRPVRVATRKSHADCMARTGFNSRDPCGSRRRHHAPRRHLGRFNSRDPCGSRRRHRQFVGSAMGVSTHATRAGRDQMFSRFTPIHALFQLTRPVRVATHANSLGQQLIAFQLTRPVRVATYRYSVGCI